MIHQSMSARSAQKLIDESAQEYGQRIRDEVWTLEFAHKCLENGVARLNLFQIAGLAKAIACFQCSNTDQN